MDNHEEQGKNKMTDAETVETTETNVDEANESESVGDVSAASETISEDVASNEEENASVSEEATPASEDEDAATSEQAKDELLDSGDSPDFKWYVVKTMTGQENKVSKALRERIVNMKMTEFFSEILVPEETVVSNVNGKKRKIKKKFFPGYVLCKMIMNEKTWHMIKDTDKITGFVGGERDKPKPLSDEEAAYMTNQAQEGFQQPRTAVNFTEGETVKVIEGPFSSFVGTVEAVSDKGKVKVNVSIFGRPTPVELDFTQVEKIS